MAESGVEFNSAETEPMNLAPLLDASLAVRLHVAAVVPAALIAAYRSAREGGRQVLGHYHSHPSGVAAPSATDAACASPDGSLWLIVADGKAALWRAGADDAGQLRFTSVALDSR